MLVACPSCRRRYRIDPGLVGPGGRRVRCNACGHLWFLAGTDGPRGRRLWLGFGLALCSSVTFALMLTGARLSYDAGADPITLNFVRSVVGLVAVWICLRAMGLRARMPARDLVPAWGVGIVLAVQSFGLLGAVDYIPVGLTVLIFYTYPAIVVVLNYFVAGERFTLPRMIALPLSFIGLLLVLALGTPAEAPDWRGVALALLGGTCLALSFVGSARLTRSRNSLVVMFHMMVAMSVGFCMVWLAVPGTAWPQGAEGWFYFAVACLAFAISVPCLFGAIAIFGPVRSSLVDTTSPVWSIVVAWLMLGEMIAPEQMAGGALVIGSVILLQLAEARRRR